MATEPTVVRQAGIVEEHFASVPSAELPLWTKADFRSRGSFLQIDNGDRIREPVRHIRSLALRSNDDRDGMSTHAEALPMIIFLIPEEDVAHSAKRDDNLTRLADGELRRIPRAIADVAEVVQALTLQDISLRRQDIVDPQDAQVIRYEIAPMHIVKSCLCQAIQGL